MFDFPSLMRQAADMLDASRNNVESRREEQGREIDPQAILDAFYTLGASATAVVKEAIEDISSRNKCSHSKNAADDDLYSEAGMSAPDVETTVNKLIARLGLVEESELAALRKRVIDLENQLKG